VFNYLEGRSKMEIVYEESLRTEDNPEHAVIVFEDQKVRAVGSNFEKGTTQGPSLQRLVHFGLDVSEKIFKCRQVIDADGS
jgi:hypothetical protein